MALKFITIMSMMNWFWTSCFYNNLTIHAWPSKLSSAINEKIIRTINTIDMKLINVDLS